MRFKFDNPDMQMERVKISNDRLNGVHEFSTHEMIVKDKWGKVLNHIRFSKGEPIKVKEKIK